MKRPYLILLASLIAICIVAIAVVSTSSPLNSPTLKEYIPRRPTEVPLLAHPSLSPQDVVNRQLAAMRSAREDPKKIEECFAFASPSNRQSIGTPEILLGLIRDSYASFLNNDSAEILDTIVVDDHAEVTVRVTDFESKEHGFQFVMTRQTTPPYQDCWMTDGVIPIKTE